MCAALSEHCAGLAEWTPPTAGMFLWIRITCCEDAGELLDKLVEDKVRLSSAYAL